MRYPHRWSHRARRAYRWMQHPLPVMLLGICCGALGTCLVSQPANHAHAQPAGAPPTLAALTAEVQILRDRLPDQAHAMHDVGQHFANLWFAARAENWDLATFFWNETRSHLRWAVRIIPVRKDSLGQEIDLQAILQAVENSPLQQLQATIVARDRASFEPAYRAMLEGCYACHKACDKPFLRLQIPEEPESRVLNFAPAAPVPTK